MAVRKKKPFCHLRRPFSAISAISAIIKTQCVRVHYGGDGCLRKSLWSLAVVSMWIGLSASWALYYANVMILAKRLKKSLAREVGRKLSLIEDGSGGFNGSHPCTDWLKWNYIKLYSRLKKKQKKTYCWLIFLSFSPQVLFEHFCKFGLTFHFFTLMTSSPYLPFCHICYS